MKNYIYPYNLRAQPKVWLWSLRDITAIGICLLLSVLALAQLRWLLPITLTLCYAFLAIRLDDYSVLDYIRKATRYFITTQQYFIWR